MKLIILARILHIGCGVFWAGSAMFLNFFVGPVLAQLGPEGPRVLKMLRDRRFPEAMFIASSFVVVSGVVLAAWRPGLAYLPSLLETNWGLCILGGALASIVSYFMGGFWLESRMRRLLRATSPEEGQRIGGQIAFWSQVNFLFLLTAVICMAIAQFV